MQDSTIIKQVLDQLVDQVSSQDKMEEVVYVAAKRHGHYISEMELKRVKFGRAPRVKRTYVKSGDIRDYLVKRK